MYGSDSERHITRGVLYLIVVILAGGIFTFALAQSKGRITGSVRDGRTAEPLPAANVMIQGTTMGAATDVEGRYTIRGLDPGSYTLVVSYVGYERVEREVQLQAGGTATVDIDLQPMSVRGEEVVVSVQAQGQREAINQQLASETISDVVSEARIRELPDVNAAESIGRLPGVSIQRQGGEATKVAIRGTAPKYNTVTVNGVRLPATGGNDRSVDLSLISSNMLDGIELKKAVTADMPADAIGGVVDLRLKQAPNRLQFTTSVQGGYNQLQNDYSNYKINGSISNRFYNNLLGVIFSFNLDNYNRSADKLSGDYRTQTEVGSDKTLIIAENLGLREEAVTRGRRGASLVMDYQIQDGKITANTFYNQLRQDGLYRINQMMVDQNRHNYNLEDRSSTTAIFTGALGIEQDFGWLKYDASVAQSFTGTESPEDYIWRFRQEGQGAFVETGRLGPNTPLRFIQDSLVNYDSTEISLQEVMLEATEREENQTAAQLNLQFPFRIGNRINGYIKTGTKFRWLDRFNDVDQTGRGGLQYGEGGNEMLEDLHQAYPEWGVDQLVSQFNHLPMYPFYSGYSRSDFLEGEYRLGPTANRSMMLDITEVLQDSGHFRDQSIGSRQNDYRGIEEYQAGYVMGRLNIGDWLTFIPGVRYERSFTRYHGQRFKEVTRNNTQQPPIDLDSLTVERENEFLLPMVHLQLAPTDWLKIRLARTETLTRPDYIQYAPITTINSYNTYVRAANSKLDPAHSTNYDASISIYEDYIGLFTISGFYKSIEDLIFQTSYFLHADLDEGDLLPGLNIPPHWQRQSPNADTYINNPFESTYQGFELSLQTNFWYLPSPFKGLVLNLNYTNIHSEMTKRLFFLENDSLITFPPPPRWTKTIKDSSRTSRMPYQPKHLANVTVGYDYKGFSARLSFLFQDDQVTFVARKPILDSFTGPYYRWDLTVQQKVGGGLELFANFNNLNSRADRNYRGHTLEDPTYTENYGFTMDVGARYSF